MAERESPAARNTTAEHEPLLDERDSFRNEAKSNSRWRFWPSFHTIHPRYRFLPFLGCLIIFLNEAEYFFKQVPSLRAIEAMYCIEYYADRDPGLAAMGKHIPERECKNDVIQKQIAVANGWIMFVRMFCAVLAAVPLSRMADSRLGRKPVMIMHKVNIVVSNSMFLAICKVTLRTCLELTFEPN
jgi:hypothetical protein